MTAETRERPAGRAASLWALARAWMNRIRAVQPSWRQTAYGLALLVGVGFGVLALLKGTIGLMGPIVNIDFILTYLAAVAVGRITGRNFPLLVSVAVLAIFAINMLSGVGLIFVYDPKILLDYLRFINDWPWRLVGSAMAGVGAAFLGYYLLARRVRYSEARLAPAVVLLVLALGADTLAKTEQGYKLLGSNNFATSSLATIKHLANGIFMHTEFAYVAQPGSSMHKAVLAGPTPPNRIMSIAVEGMGIGRDAAFNETLARRLEEKVAPYYYVQRTTHSYKGLTIAGEFRELCGLRLLFAPNRENVAGFADQCLPNRLKSMGYITTGMHGNTGFFYDRIQLYPALGFDRMLFRNDLLRRGGVDCPSRSFPGICDRDTLRIGLGLFGHQPREFVHVVSLDTHYPYAANKPSDTVCEGAAAKLATDLCIYRNQFADAMGVIGTAIAEAKVKPDVIFVYGDHAPTFVGEKLRSYFDREDVPVYVLTLRTQG